MESRPFLLLTKRPVLWGVSVFLLLLSAGLYIAYQQYLLSQRPVIAFLIFTFLLTLAGGILAWYLACKYEKLRQSVAEKDELLRRVEASYNALFRQAPGTIVAGHHQGTKSTTLEKNEPDLRFKSMVEKSKVGVYIFSGEKLIYVNPRFAEIFGYRADELVAYGTLELLFHKDDIHLVKQFVRESSENKNNSNHYEVRGIRKNGHIVWLELYGSASNDNDESSAIGTLQDITARKRSTSVILQERNLLNTLVRGLPGIFYLIDAKGRFLQWNENLEKLTGCSPDELSAKHTTDFVSQPWTRFVQQKRGEAFSKGKATGEIEIVTREEQRLTYFITIMPILYNDQECILGIGIDFTKKKEAELSLAERNFQIKERVKELQCLYGVSEIVNNGKFSIGEMLSACVHIIPSAYQYPSITCVRIAISDQHSESDGFVETSWKQESEIKVKERAIGKIVVAYNEEKAAADEGPFLKEERLLIDSLADIIGNACERRFVDEEVFKFSRLYQFTSAINENMLRAEDKETIFSSACQVAVNQGKFRMAWVGHYNEETQEVVPYVWAGHNQGYLEDVKISADRENLGKGPAGMAIRSRHYFYSNDIANDPAMLPWREEALKRGYRSVISFPIVTHAKVESLFSLYMSEAFFFNDEEIKLLTEVTKNIAYAIEKIELKEQQEKAEAELRESEGKFRSLVEDTLVSVFIMQDGKVVYVNPQFEKTVGYSKQQLLQEISIEQLIHPDDIAMIRKKQANLASNEKTSDHFTFKVVRSDNTVIHMEIIVSPITYQSKPATIGTIIDITEEVEKEKRISKAVIDAQENERRLMSMELHDNVKQILTATVLNVDFIDMALNDKETLNRIVGNVKRYLREAIEELRRISHRLSPSIDSVLSLEEKVKALVRSMNVSDGVKVVYHFDDFKKPIEDDIQLMLYRILQEQLTNIAKHANASLIEIALRDDNGNIEMMVQDNGDGFDTRTTKSGIGLENIKRRLTALDGRMEIVSSPGNGCRMVIRIPEESRGEL